MSLRSNVEWRAWGRADPLWAVSTWRGRHRAGANPWTDEEFYALGHSDWVDFARKWQRYGLRRGVAVEIGCGAGRLTKPMLSAFQHVIALDVSPDMLAYAEARIRADNLEYRLVNGCEIPCNDHSVDAVFSTHVFQHLDCRDDATRTFGEVARVLAPGGSMMIHAPVFAWPHGAGPWVERLYWLNKRLEDLKARWRRRLILRGRPVALMRMQSYAMSYFYELLPRLGFEHIEITTFATRSNGDPHSFVLARRR